MLSYKSKKGVSPLIATILLIAFAVALGSVVIQWGWQLGLSKTPDRCKNSELTLKNIGENQLCVGGAGSNGYINFILENTGAVEISGLSIFLTGDKGTQITEINDILIGVGLPYEKKDRDIAYDSAKYGNVKSVQFVPKIKGTDSTEICLQKALRTTKVGNCQ